MTVSAACFSDLQSINPSAIIELFVLELKTSLHGSNTSPSNENNIYRFHAGSNLNANGEIVFDGKSYMRFPLKAEGFAYQRGQIPRPKITIANGTGFISALLLTVNETTVGNDLTGSKVTRIKTMFKFIDAVNYSNGQNPDADPTAIIETQVYEIDRKSSESRETVEFELAAPFDLDGINIPKRQCTRTEFPSIGTFV